MSETGTPATRPFPWLKAVLVMSLAVNLLFIGAGVARFLVREPPERVMGLSQVQIVPRKFFSELERDRKAELLGVFREFGPTFRDGRRETRDQAVRIAEALEAEPYDAARVRAAIDGFSSGSERLVAAGGQAAFTLIERLTPEERKRLAKHIRLRGERGRGARRGGS
jgi:hypothetical protein